MLRKLPFHDMIYSFLASLLNAVLGCEGIFFKSSKSLLTHGTVWLLGWKRVRFHSQQVYARSTHTLTRTKNLNCFVLLSRSQFRVRLLAVRFAAHARTIVCEERLYCEPLRCSFVVRFVQYSTRTMPCRVTFRARVCDYCSIDSEGCCNPLSTYQCDKDKSCGVFGFLAALMTYGCSCLVRCKSILWDVRFVEMKLQNTGPWQRLSP